MAAWGGVAATILLRPVEQVFHKYLECGIFAHGFARVRCGDCAHDFLIAFLCKGCGVVPRAPPGVWPRRRHTWMTTCFHACQCASGCCPYADHSRAFTDPDVLVLGAGQAGLAVAGRLQQLDIAALVVDREKRVGDNWRNRYQSLLLRNQIWANHLPYLPFPSSWSAYLSKDEMAGKTALASTCPRDGTWAGTVESPIPPLTRR